MKLRYLLPQERQEKSSPKVFQDNETLDWLVDEKNDPVVYEVIKYKKTGSDIFFGTTTMEPGDVAGLFFEKLLGTNPGGLDATPREPGA